MPKRRSSSRYKSSRKRIKGASSYRVVDVTGAPKSMWIKNKKAVKVRMPKKIKVSPMLKAKIQKVIDNKKHVSGSHTLKYLGGRMFSQSRTQNVFESAGAGANVPGFLFTAGQILDAASNLWSSKALRTPAGNYNWMYQLQNSDNFNPETAQIFVKNSFCSYEFKNGSQHTVNIILCVGVPKKKGSNIEWLPDAKSVQDGDGNVTANDSALISLRKSWEDSLATDLGLGLFKQGYSAVGSGLTGVVTLQNPSIADIERLPSNSRTLRNRYKVEEIHLRLLPGQTVKHKIQGPKGYMLDCGKCYDPSGKWINMHSFSRSVMAIVYNDPNFVAVVPSGGGNMTNAVCGRFADQIDTQEAGFAIAVERTDHFSLACPEQTGFTLDSIVLGQDQALDQRYPRQLYSVIDVAAAIPGSGTSQVVDLSVMNPAINVNSGNSGT